MKADRNKAIVRRILCEGMGQNRPDVIDETVAADYVNHSFPQSAPGLAGFKRTIEMFATAFPDGELVVEDAIAEGDKVVTRGYWTGTHTGAFLNVVPTGERIKLPYIDIWAVRDGRGQENWVQMDLLGLMQQLVAASAPTRSDPPSRGEPP